MNSLSSLKEEFNYRPVKIEFAGLYGDTVSMVRSGWELNLSTDRYDRNSYVVYINGINRSLNLRIMSARLAIDANFVLSNKIRMLEYINGIHTRIECCASNIVVNIAGKTDMIASNWSGEIGFADVSKIKQANFDDLFHFPSLDKTVFIPESKIWTIEEHLDAIRKAQEPFQDQLLREDRFKEKQQTKLKLIGVS